MTGTDAAAPLLDPDQARFLTGPVAINVASRDPALIPSVARAYGCRVSADRRRVVVFVAARRAAVLLRDLERRAPLAAVFTRPTSHETLQLKSAGARVEGLAPGDRALMQAYAAAFGDEIRGLGYGDAFVGALLAPTDEDAVGIAFAPDALFEQTPGPAAGRRLDRTR